MPGKPFQNRLIKEKSPYLLQHAHNPVDWFPWGDEAFDKAREKDKPIFLSIGYATCHWCHVMSRESFESPELAILMNDVFINIKVDREELPEVDNLYMEFAQALMASGTGWPLNVILTPDLKPFYAVSYLPPEERQGMMGLHSLIEHIRKLWDSEEKELLFDQADKLVDLFEKSVMTRGDEVPSDALLNEAVEMLFEGSDPVYGGQKGAPKFPLGYQCQFLFNYAFLNQDSRPLYFAEKTLSMIARGGIYDQLGGGFARYSVDEKWLVPHFEKMLYDNAILAAAYLDGWRLLGKKEFKQVCIETLDYILREMQYSEGGFYSAEDAETEGIEGAYYLWTLQEVEDLLPADEAALFCEYFNVTDMGNFEGKNILHRLYSIEEFTEYRGLHLEDVKASLAQSMNLLREIRSIRKHPFKDDKILVSWNGLMIDTLIRAGIALERADYVEAGVRAADFIRHHLWKEGCLYRRYREGEVHYEGGLDDYASMIRALLTLYESGQGDTYLEWAIEMTTLLEQDFKADRGAFYLTGPNHSILLRRCELYDSSQPSGNALHTENLIRLYQITHNREYWIQAEDVLKVAKSFIEAYPQGASYHLLNLMRFLDKELPTLVVALDKNETGKKEILYEVYSKMVPHLAVSYQNDSETYPLLEGKTTYYACKQGKCHPPVSEVQKVIDNL